ncbi:response regulator transcription factor [Azospirillum doebereinerae]|uniref:response regulator transcription factor n=1 Tax=Azospirillum doebereinerae TaxID=92933 RepID=UPI001EE55719|nr:response regulator transcription factor [Azospirillum doebereinerae]MCG5238656.1 response regulator transcription factor [Azospirillum doebereinerae]
MALDVLVVEDHEDLREEIVLYLQARGMIVRAAGNGREMDEAMAARQPDIVLLDLGLPEEDGVSIARRLSGANRPGVVVITARGRVEDRILGLNAGADLYLVKPLDMRELEAAIGSVMRRREGAEPRLQTWRLEAARWRLVTPGGAIVTLSDAETRLLAPLFEAPEAVVDRQTLADRLEVDSRSIDLLVHRLRRKVETSTGESLPLRTLRARGYSFAAPTAF